MRRSILWVVLCSAVFLFGLPTLQAEMVWNAYDQFNTTAGTNDSSQTWQYLRATDGSYTDDELLPTYMASYFGWNCWRQTDSELPYIGKDVADGEIRLHPGNLSAPAPYTTGKNQAVIGFKAPYTATYSVSYSMTDRATGDGDGFSYGMYKGGVGLLASGYWDDGGASGLLSLTNVSMSAGQMLYLNVGNRATISSDLTGVYFQVSSPIPEPGTCTLCGLGMIGLLAYAWRKRK
jgi:hypothetical protein